MKKYIHNNKCYERVYKDVEHSFDLCELCDNEDNICDHYICGKGMYFKKINVSKYKLEQLLKLQAAKEGVE